ncbi:hypothetical protein E4U61_003568 [Claviceps capensis]|nr:hypothetical protein E4U61_003568 [Claviceps capensis]
MPSRRTVFASDGGLTATNIREESDIWVDFNVKRHGERAQSVRCDVNEDEDEDDDVESLTDHVKVLPTTLQVSYKKPLLSSVDHWDDWIEALQQFAEGQGFWSNVNLNNPEYTADALRQPRVATADECQQFITKHSTPANPVTLHDAIQYQHMIYQEQVRLYKEQEVKLRSEPSILGWQAPVHASALEKIRKDKDTSLVTPRQLAKEFKAKFAQDPMVKSAAMSSRYLDLLRQAQMGSVEPERWIADWNVMYQVTRKRLVKIFAKYKGPTLLEIF